MQLYLATNTGASSLLNNGLILTVKHGADFQSTFNFLDSNLSNFYSKPITGDLSFDYEDKGHFFQWVEATTSQQMKLYSAKFPSNASFTMFKFNMSRCILEFNRKESFEDVFKRRKPNGLLDSFLRIIRLMRALVYPNKTLRLLLILNIAMLIHLKYRILVPPLKITLDWFKEKSLDASLYLKDHLYQFLDLILKITFL